MVDLWMTPYYRCDTATHLSVGVDSDFGCSALSLLAPRFSVIVLTIIPNLQVCLTGQDVSYLTELSC